MRILSTLLLSAFAQCDVSSMSTTNAAAGGACTEGATIADGSSCTTQCAADYVNFPTSISCTGTSFEMSLICEEKPSNGGPVVKHIDGQDNVMDISLSAVQLPACADPVSVLTATVTRPTGFTSMRGEWVGIYEKDSWSRIAWAREATTNNNFGTLIPTDGSGLGEDGYSLLDREFTDTTLTATFTIGGSDPSCVRLDREDLDIIRGGTSTDGCDENQAEFWDAQKYFPPASRGEYEFRYASPHSTFGEATAQYGNWIAHEFPLDIMRVGQPFETAACDPASRDLPSYTDKQHGVIVPAFYGHPIARRSQYDLLQTAMGELSAWTDPNVVVLLNIFYEGMDFSWTTAEQTAWQQIATALSNVGVKVVGTIDKEAADKGAVMDQYIALLPGTLGGFAFKEYGRVGDTVVDAQALVNTMKGKNNAFISVFLSGETPFSADILNVPDITVSVIHDSIGRYMPYAWYSEYNPLRSGIILTNVGSTQVEDHYNDLSHYGYGYFFFHDNNKDTFQYPTSYLNNIMTFLAALHQAQADSTRRLEGGAVGRGLQEVEVFFGTQEQSSDEEYEWVCDELKFECTPKCQLRKGVRRAFVQDSFCKGSKGDSCRCDCFYNVHWKCTDGVAACHASSRSYEGVVGDKVCVDRGTEKPGSCSKDVSVARGAAIDGTCVTTWDNERNAVTETPTTPSTEQSTETPQSNAPATPNSAPDTTIDGVDASPSFSALLAAPLVLALSV